ncbi:hypothetical protein VTK73DRAFT_3331 [Phialemonium thermophilum]|uniref:DUF1279 domain-containing protein n=1 Tax=Phialemonium thermophilum TaxID=223376 RepID=A0ABR3X095_9PEZI
MFRTALGTTEVLIETTGINGAARKAPSRLPSTRGMAFNGFQGPVPWHNRMGLSKFCQRQFGTRSSASLYSRGTTSLWTKAIPKRVFHSSPIRASPKEIKGTADVQSPSLSARLKKLSKEYGWSAVGVYLGLTLLDFPFCFLLVRTLGTDKIAVAEEFVVSNVKKIIPQRVKTFWHDYREALNKKEADSVGDNGISEELESAGWGVKEADERNKAEASLATQLALAYAIHKSFIFVRVPLTAAVTPKVVRVLRSWGWQIGKRRPKT